MLWPRRLPQAILQQTIHGMIWVGFWGTTGNRTFNTKKSRRKKIWDGTKSKVFTQKRCPRASVLNSLDRFVSISAGDNHLLALTNRGRTFAHPVNKEANHFGQLGLRAFEIADPASIIMGTKPENLKVELLPKTAKDPPLKSIRITPSSDVTTDLSNIDDSKIYWCTHLYEIPSLRGVDVSQVATGGRSSFVRTPTGRVLGWGGNEYGWVTPLV